MSFEEVIFYFITGITIFSAIGVAGTRNIFHAAVYLLFSIIGLAGILIFLEAEFFAFAMVLVYVSVILLIILFILFLNAGSSWKFSESTRAHNLVGFLVTSILITVMIYVGTKTQWLEPAVSNLNSSPRSLAEMIIYEYVFALELISLIFLSSLIGAALFTRKAH